MVKRCAECDHRFWDNEAEAAHIFCRRCRKRKCINCGVVLSKHYQCYKCNEKHGEPSIWYPSIYCKGCVLKATYLPLECMNQELKDYFDKIKKAKIENLRNLVLDIGYFESVLTRLPDEAKLRLELNMENQKRVQISGGNGSGETPTYDDKRDINKVKELETNINRIVQVKGEKTKYTQLLNEIKEYVGYINNLTDERVREINDVADLIK